MTTIRHTPGPWQSDGKLIVAPDPQGIHPDIYIAEIVETDDEGRMAPPEQQEANRNIVTAAPELLDAILDVKRLAEKSGDCEIDPFALLDVIACKARTVLAIVTGGEP